MLEDTFESMEDGEDMEEEAEEEVDKILFEITAGEKIRTAVLIYPCVFNKHICQEFWIRTTMGRLLSRAKKSLTALCYASLVSLGALGKAPGKVTDALPEMEPAGAMAASDNESEEDIEEMQSRLAALRS